jgi:parallel beta-helix repeat protein
MKKLILILLLGFQFSWSATYFVTTTGNSGNNGLSEGNAWSLTHAFATAVAGDIVNVKAGNYGYIILSTARSGTAGNLIKFIGYKTTPNDIVSTNGSTYTVANWEANGRALPSTEMPLLSQFPANEEPLDTDRAFKVNHNYMHIENFMVRGYQYGVDAEVGTLGSVFKNMIFYKMGDWNPADPNYGGSSVATPTNQKGFGIRLTNSNSNIISNTTTIDAGFIGLWLIGCDNNTLTNNAVYVRDSGNASDYLTELNDSNNNTITNLIGNRIVNDLSVGHQGRGFTLKLSNNNTITDLVCLNVRVQVNVDSNINIFKNVTLTGSGGSNQNEFQLYGMSDNNIIENLKLFNGGGIQFLGWAGEEGGFPTGSYPAGDNNYFINPIIDDLSALGGNGIISFHRLGPTDASAGNNYIIGGTFNDASWIMNVNRTGTITFYNTTFSNVTTALDTFSSGFPDQRGNYTANYINCNFFGNGFANPTGTAITSHNPLFTNENAGDFSLQSGSSLRNIGVDRSNLTARAGFDFIGATRDATPDIGAYEFGGGIPPVVSSILKSNETFGFIN